MYIDEMTWLDSDGESAAFVKMTASLVMRTKHE